VESFCKTYVHEEILRPRLYSPDGNKFADKGFISCLAKSWFAGYYSRIFARSYAQNEKKKKTRPARIARIYRAWEVEGARFRFLRIPSNFPEIRETRSGRSRRHSRSPSSGKNIRRARWTNNRRSTAHAGGEFIEHNFPRSFVHSLARSLIVLTFLHADTRARMHTDAWESRVGYLPRMHRAAHCTAWIFIRLFEESRADDGNDDWKSPAWKKSAYVPRKLVAFVAAIR